MHKSHSSLISLNSVLPFRHILYFHSKWSFSFWAWLAAFNNAVLSRQVLIIFPNQQAPPQFVLALHLCPLYRCTATAFIHPSPCRKVRMLKMCGWFRLGSNSHSVAWSNLLSDQCSVLRQINVTEWSRGSAHMMLWRRQTRGGVNVIRECSCVSARHNTPLRCVSSRENETAISLFS